MRSFKDCLYASNRYSARLSTRTNPSSWRWAHDENATWRWAQEEDTTRNCIQAFHAANHPLRPERLNLHQESTSLDREKCIQLRETMSMMKGQCQILTFVNDSNDKLQMERDELLLRWQGMMATLFWQSCKSSIIVCHCTANDLPNV